jgi:hypothetical protein
MLLIKTKRERKEGKAREVKKNVDGEVIRKEKRTSYVYIKWNVFSYNMMPNKQ